jgi:hypothetical protein
MLIRRSAHPLASVASISQSRDGHYPLSMAAGATQDHDGLRAHLDDPQGRTTRCEEKDCWPLATGHGCVPLAGTGTARALEHLDRIDPVALFACSPSDLR